MNQALQQEPQAVTAARGLMAKKLEDPRVTAALAVAEACRGIVVTTDAEAIAVTENMKTLSTAEKFIDADRKRLLEIPAAMVKAVNQTAKTVTDPIGMAKAALIAANGRFLAAKENQRKAALRAQEEAQRAVAAVAQEEGEDVVPLEEPQQVKPQTMIRAGEASFVATKNLKLELVNAHDADVAWLALSPPTAPKESFLDHLKRGEVPEPPLLEPNPRDKSKAVVWKGVRFWYEPGGQAR